MITTWAMGIVNRSPPHSSRKCQQHRTQHEKHDQYGEHGDGGLVSQTTKRPNTQQQQQQSKDDPYHWKISVVFHTVDPSRIRMFLRYHGFQEYPIKTTHRQSTHSSSSDDDDSDMPTCATNQHFTTVTPYHPHRKVHVHTETTMDNHTLSVSPNETVLLQRVRHTEYGQPSSTGTTPSVYVQQVTEYVEYGSVFKRNDMSFVMTLVNEFPSTGNWCNTTTNKECAQAHPHTDPPNPVPPIRGMFYIHATWPAKTSSAYTRKTLTHLSQLITWFDF